VGGDVCLNSRGSVLAEFQPYNLNAKESCIGFRLKLLFKTISAFPRHLKKLYSGRISVAQDAGLLVLTLAGVLLLLSSSAALVAAALTWQTAASRGGIAGQARMAAERGFHEVIDRLNDPANGHLLVTNWDSANKNWVTVDSADLSTCQISSNPLGAVARSEILSKTQAVGGRQVRYTLTNFTPPRYPSPSNPPTTLPPECRSKFGNLAGGTAQFTIVGEVLQSGVVVSRYQLRRDTTVSSFRDTTPDNPPVSGPLAFFGTGGGGSTGFDVKSNTRLALDTSLNWEYNSADANINVFCLINCTGSGSLNDIPHSKINYPLATFTALFPPSPPYSTQLDGVTARAVKAPITNFPYSSSRPTLNNSNLNSACRLVSLPTMSGTNQDAIACRINSIELAGQEFRVDTSRNDIPVVLYLIGNNKFELKESGSNASSIVNTRFRDFRDTQPTSWNYLRIFGDPSSSFSFPISSSLTNPNSCNNGSTQYLNLVKGSSINGAFVWLPKGRVDFDAINPTSKGSDNYADKSKYALYGALWACKTVLKENSVLLTNGSSGQIGTGIDQAIGLGVFRYVAQGVERSQ
jgi:hypothetical protein